MTKSRRASSPVDRKALTVDQGLRECGISDPDGWFRDRFEDGLEEYRTAKAIITDQGGDDHAVAYTQNMHTALLTQLAHHAVRLSIANEFARRDRIAIEELQAEVKRLKSAKALQRKSLDSRFSLDDLEVEQVDDRNVRIALVRGEDQAEFSLKFPVVIDRGVWNERVHYERGDGVTHKGAFWICQDDQQGKPGDGSTWRLAVKAGRDGRDADGTRAERRAA